MFLECLEYSAPVQTSLFSAPLSIDRTIIQTQLSNCLFESKPLIYGGSLAIHGEFPHMVRKKKFFEAKTCLKFKILGPFRPRNPTKLVLWGEFNK